MCVSQGYIIYNYVYQFRYMYLMLGKFSTKTVLLFKHCSNLNDPSCISSKDVE